MKLLLDEQLPRRLAHRLVPLHDALTVQDMDWRGKKTGELLKLLAGRALVCSIHHGR